MTDIEYLSIMNIAPEYVNDTPFMLFQCDNCRHTFKAKDVILQMKGLNTILPSDTNIIKAKYLFACPKCKELHLKGFKEI